MIRGSGIIFENRVEVEKKNNTLKKQSKKKFADLNGDSGVGQASEFPFKLRKFKLPRRSHFFNSSGFLSFIGTILILISVFGFIFTYGPLVKVELGYRLSRLFTKQEIKKGSFADIINKDLLGEIEGIPDPNFSLLIPKIHAKGKVYANIDPRDEKAYMEALKTGIAHAAGTALPGMNGNIYLFAHSTDSPINIIRYNAVFYLLRELENNDDVNVYYEGVKHHYVVYDKKIVDPTDTEYLTPQNAENKEKLILQTCWPPGTTLKRLLIFAQKKEV